MSLASLTTAQLETMRDDLIAAIGRTLNSQSYTAAGESLTRARIPELQALLSSVSEELAARDDTTGGMGLAEFSETS